MGGRVNNTKARTLPYDSELIAIVKERGLNSACLHILVYLRSRMNAKRKTPVCWPKQLTMVEDTGLDERTVRRALYNLKNAGLIRIGKQYLKGNLLQYEFIPWWPLCTEKTGQKSRSEAVKNAGLQPVKNVGKQPVKNACSESIKVESNKKNKRNESPPLTPQGNLKGEGLKTFSKAPGPDQRNDSKAVSSDREVGGKIEQQNPRSRKVQQLATVKKANPELFNDATRYAEYVFEARKYNLKLSNESPIKPEHKKEYLLEVAHNAFYGDKAKQEAFQEWQAGHERRSKRRWVAVEEMMGQKHC